MCMYIPAVDFCELLLVPAAAAFKLAAVRGAVRTGTAAGVFNLLVAADAAGFIGVLKDELPTKLLKHKNLATKKRIKYA